MEKASKVATARSAVIMKDFCLLLVDVALETEYSRLLKVTRLQQ